MTGKKEKERFLFFKYVPPKRDKNALKNEEYKQTKNDSDADTEWFGPEFPEMPCNPPYGEPECPSYPEGPAEGEYPELPEYPEMPEYPEIPECPEVPEYPEIPECPELPEIPECPELPEIPECPEIPEIPEGPCPENAVMHVIQAGDTFWKLARQYGTTVEAIAAANPDLDPLNLQIGETICIPLGIPGAKG